LPYLAVDAMYYTLLTHAGIRVWRYQRSNQNL